MRRILDWRRVVSRGVGSPESESQAWESPTGHPTFQGWDPMPHSGAWGTRAGILVVQGQELQSQTKGGGWGWAGAKVEIKCSDLGVDS